MLYKAATAIVVLAGLAIALPTDPYAQPTLYKEDPIPYNYAYGVKDDYAGTDFGHNEDSDGKSVKGSYTVQLPDGRKQTVNYVADHYNGYQAEVSYYGEAQYPHEYGPPITFKPQAYPEPVYKPQPVYQ
ncbi:cuticle protein 18.6-like [Macrobrachium rosenbergii]|uniref:cuticle protein 18.6-like n=1 Tax=Macrobrachium rosenbergii TaxID=79674 RepID=UPI0034D5E8AA